MPRDRVAYILKGYPRLSELFIASEIWRLEQLGVPLRLFVIKPPDEPKHHPVVDRIVTAPTYLPATSSLSQESLPRWLRHNAGPFLPSVGRVAIRHPIRLLRTALTAMSQAVRARKGWRPRSIYLKELLQAIAVADHLGREPDVRHLHAHFAHGTTTITWLTSMLCGLPFSFTGHAKDIYLESLNPAGLLARKLRAADFVVTCTAANAAYLRETAPGARVFLVYHGLNADFAMLLPDAVARVQPDRLRVVSVGRLVPKKGFDVLVEAAALLRWRGIDLELVIAGEDGQDSARVRALIEDLGVAGSVRLCGPWSQQELLTQYCRSTLFALACRVDGDGDRDGIPNVLVEAMAAGLPVVSTAVSGIPELVRDGHNGLLVPPDDPSALADAMQRLAQDAPARCRLAAAAADTVARDFDGDVLARRMAVLFEGAMA